MRFYNQTDHFKLFIWNISKLEKSAINTSECKKNSKRSKNKIIDMDHLYSAGGIASAWHSKDAPEYNNAVVNRSGPTALIVGGSRKKSIYSETMNKSYFV